MVRFCSDVSVIVNLLMALLLIQVSDASASDNLTDAIMTVDRVAGLKVEMAERDAKAAMAHGDRRLLAVYGITFEVPGTVEAVPILRQKFGLRVLQGTGDALNGSKDKAFNDNARRYAKKYNQTVLSDVQRNPSTGASQVDITTLKRD